MLHPWFMFLNGSICASGYVLLDKKLLAKYIYSNFTNYKVCCFSLGALRYTM
jgi:hypothetical protein